MNIKIHKSETTVSHSNTKHSHKSNVPTRMITKSKHTIKNLQNLKEFNRMLVSTLPVLFPDVSSNLIQDKLKYIYHLYQSKGPEFVIRYLKASHESLENLVFKQGLTLQHEKISIGKDKDQWPRWLGLGLKSKVLNHNDIESIRFAFTLCSLRRLITIPTFTNLTSITSPPSFNSDTLQYIREETREEAKLRSKHLLKPVIGSVLEDPDEGVVVTTPTPQLEVSMKSGPNGISFFSFPYDRAAIVGSPMEEKLFNFSSIFYSGSIDDWFEEKLEPYEPLVDLNRQLFQGKISLTFEGGKLKPRVFAMVDSFTQTLLRPFHKVLMNMLKDIPEDCTFHHDKVPQIAKNLYSCGHTFYGYADLSNASDAIPKELYRDAGNDMCSGLGDAWVSVFDRDFSVPKSVLKFWKTDQPTKNFVRYNTGQPMGALSSWPFMAYVHHRIVWAAFKGRNKSRGQYLILGDDVVIFDRPAYTKYCELLEELGVPYTNNVSTVGFEFAKRVFFQGHEITGAYTSALWASRNMPEVFAMEWRTLATRGYKSGLDLPLCFRKLLKVSRKRFNRCILLMSIPYGTDISVESLVKFVLNHTGRSDCFLQVGETDRYVEVMKTFRQAATILIQQSFQKLLDESKAAVLLNAERFSAEFRKSSGLSDHSPSVMQTAINEYTEGSMLRIRYLERDLKRAYLGGVKVIHDPKGDYVVPTTPSNKNLLRPNFPQIPRKINFSKREKHVEQIKFRATHHFGIINMLKG